MARSGADFSDQDPKQAMLDIKWIRDDPAALDRARARRGLPPVADRIVGLDTERLGERGVPPADGVRDLR